MLPHFLAQQRSHTYWRAFWTAGYLAFLVHVYWAIWGTCGGDLHIVFNSKVPKPPSECLVEHPVPDFFLTAWWGLDVLLAWLITDNIKLLRVERGALHVLVFTMFFRASVLASKAGIVAHLLGILTAIVVIGCVMLRLMVQESDPKSLIATLYVGFFQFLNLLHACKSCQHSSLSPISAHCARCCASRICTLFRHRGDGAEWAAADRAVGAVLSL